MFGSFGGISTDCYGPACVISRVKAATYLVYFGSKRQQALSLQKHCYFPVGLDRTAREKAGSLKKMGVPCTGQADILGASKSQWNHTPCFFSPPYGGS